MTEPDPNPPKRRDRLSKMALTIPCRHCKAKPAEWCTSRHSWAPKLHKARTDPVAAIYRAGARDATRAIRSR